MLKMIQRKLLGNITWLLTFFSDCMAWCSCRISFISPSTPGVPRSFTKAKREVSCFKHCNKTIFSLDLKIKHGGNQNHRSGGSKKRWVGFTTQVCTFSAQESWRGPQNGKNWPILLEMINQRGLQSPLHPSRSTTVNHYRNRLCICKW